MELNKRQKSVKKELKINAENVKNGIVGFMRDYFAAANQTKAVIGISGGIDSAVSGYLAKEALGPENIITAYLPYSDMAPGNNLIDVEAVLDGLSVPVENRNLINIANMIEGFEKDHTNITPLRLGNIMARVRMVILYDLAAQYGGLVVGTSNRTEFLTGYFTKFGDGGVDIEPIGDLFKTQVYQLSRYVNVPDAVIQKAPSANLWPGQTDEKELGYTYEFLDVLLYLMYVKMTPDDILADYYGYYRKDIEAVRKKVNAGEHKRNLAPVYKIGF